MGYKAEIAFSEEDDTGIVFLTNSPNSVASKSIPDFLDLIFDYNDNKKILTNTEVSDPETLHEKGQI